MLLLQIIRSLIDNNILRRLTILRRRGLINSLTSCNRVINSRRMTRTLFNLRIIRRIRRLVLRRRIRDKSNLVTRSSIQVRDRNSYSNSALALTTKGLIQMATRRKDQRLSRIRRFLSAINSPLKVTSLISTRQLLSKARSKMRQIRQAMKILRRQLRITTRARRVLNFRHKNITTFMRRLTKDKLRRIGRRIHRNKLTKAKFTRSNRNNTTLSKRKRIISNLRRLLLTQRLRFLNRIISNSSILTLLGHTFTNSIIVRRNIHILATLLNKSSTLKNRQQNNNRRSLNMQILQILRRFRKQSKFSSLALMRRSGILNTLNDGTRVINSRRRNNTRQINRRIRIIRSTLLRNRIRNKNQLINSRRIETTNRASNSRHALTRAAKRLIQRLANANDNIKRANLKRRAHSAIVRYKTNSMLLDRVPDLVVNRTNLSRIINRTPTNFKTQGPFINRTNSNLIRNHTNRTNLTRNLLNLNRRFKRFLNTRRNLIIITLSFSLITNRDLNRNKTLLINRIRIINLRYFLSLKTSAPRQIRITRQILERRARLNTTRLIRLTLLNTNSFLTIRLSKTISRIANTKRRARRDRNKNKFTKAKLTRSNRPLTEVSNRINISRHIRQLTNINNRISNRIPSFRRQAVFFLRNRRNNINVIDRYVSPLPLLEPFNSSNQKHP